MWLGIFMLERDSSNALFRNAGLGMVAYALALMVQLLGRLPDAPQLVDRLFWVLLIFPPYYWSGAVLHLGREDLEPRGRLISIWQSGIAALGLLAVFLLLPSALLPADRSVPTPAGLAAIALVNLLPLLALACNVRSIRSRKPGIGGFAALAAATLFFTLGIGLLLFQFDWLPPTWIFLAIALDFELLGLAIIWFDAFDSGERVVPEFLRALAYGWLLALLFGGQAGIVIALSTGYSYWMALVLHLTVTIAFLVAAYADSIQAWIERFAYRNQPGLQADQRQHRAAARAHSRLDQHLDPLAEDEERFTRLTRRALSNFGNLPKLAASPLTNLALIDARLSGTRQPDSTLLRARELKNLLADAVLKLKPASQEMFGESEEWRFFNALYFPYVLGLRPYSRRLALGDLDPDHRKALEWFRTQVPERTLYNWQKTAAGLVARDLLEQSANLSRSGRPGGMHAAA
jgi:hypothetical protein